jgi:hypothetical protein
VQGVPLTWSLSRQHATAAESEMPGNELVTTQNIGIVRYKSSRYNSETRVHMSFYFHCCHPLRKRFPNCGALTSVGELFVFGGERVFYMMDTFIFNEICVQDKIYILVGSLVG